MPQGTTSRILRPRIIPAVHPQGQASAVAPASPDADVVAYSGSVRRFVFTLEWARPLPNRARFAERALFCRLFWCRRLGSQRARTNVKSCTSQRRGDLLTAAACASALPCDALVDASLRSVS